MCLINGRLTAADYEDAAAKEPRVDALRCRITCVENPEYSRDYLAPDKRSIANAVQVFFCDGTATPNIEVQFPIGHRRRRREAIPLLIEKFKRNLERCFSVERVAEILDLCLNEARLLPLPVSAFVDRLVANLPSGAVATPAASM